MPHYKDGKEANPGDRLRFPTRAYDGAKYRNTTREGTVLVIDPGPTTCNAQVAYLTVDDVVSGAVVVKVTAVHKAYVTLSECEKVEFTD